MSVSIRTSERAQVRQNFWAEVDASDLQKELPAIPTQRAFLTSEHIFNSHPRAPLSTGEVDLILINLDTKRPTQ